MDANLVDLTSDSPPQRKRALGCTVEDIVDQDQECTSSKDGLDLHFFKKADSSELQWFDVVGDDVAKLDPVLDREWMEVIARGILWSDPTFPPVKTSIVGPKDDQGSGVDGSCIPRCRCGNDAKQSVVQKDTPNKGRPYFHCADRRCPFFAWSDNRRSQSADFTWKRFTDFVVVSDYGFSANDLMQGGVGDCWFLSALAVVAERHDLIARLFADTSPTMTGCYNIRLFLDGCWRSVLVDDQFPCTTNPRRPELAVTTGLAFSRAAGQQLWVCLLEKAYAKAHGSYHAISGGEIAEALLDLTGAPACTINFDSRDFNMDAMWDFLVFCKSEGLPMGCATAGDPQLKEVGLCGNHAYSILECREIQDPQQPSTRVRLLRIRNPHGVGEWNGDWCDGSLRWSGSISGLERTGVDDGTFWMDLTHFVMGFALVDVCMAHRGWHASSLPNAFCQSNSGWRVNRDIYRVRSDSGSVFMYVTALQPTRRGVWCRSDRKRSYRPGDVSLMVARLSAGGARCEVVAASLGNAVSARGSTLAFSMNESEGEYFIIAFNLGAPPMAADTSKEQPFFIRIYSSAPVQVAKEPFGNELGALCLMTFYNGIDMLCNSRFSRSRLEGQSSHSEHSSAFHNSTGHSHVLIERCCAQTLQKIWHPLGSVGDCGIMEFRSRDGVSICIAVNKSQNALRFHVEIAAKVVIARGSEGILKSNEEIAQQLNTAAAMRAQQSTKRSFFRFPAKWKYFRTSSVVPATQNAAHAVQKLVLVVISSGVQSELARISCRCELENSLSIKSPEVEGKLTLQKRTKRQATLNTWLGLPQPSATRSLFPDLESGIFSAYHCQGDAFPLPPIQTGNFGKAVGDPELEMMLAMSKSEHESVEDQILRHILSESLSQQLPRSDPNGEEESDLQRAMQNSANDEAKIQELDDQMLQAAIAASLKSDSLQFVAAEKNSKTLLPSNSEVTFLLEQTQHIGLEDSAKNSDGAIIVSDSDCDQPND